MTKPNKFEVNQRVEIHGLEVFNLDTNLNGEIVTIVDLPGHNDLLPLAYKVLMKDGTTTLAIEKYMRLFPPVLPRGRGDIDQKITWTDFDKGTGLDSATFRFENTNPDY